MGRTNMQLDKEAMERFEDIAKLSDEKRSYLFSLIDMCLRDFKTRKAYTKT